MRRHPRVASRISQLLLISIVLLGSPLLAQSKREHVHRMAHIVMPFDISKVTHVFEMTETGGVERIVVKDPQDSAQISLIRRHLAYEAKKFQRGDYSDPAKLHGIDMPGLKALEAGASGIEITYSDLPHGGEITFKTKDLALLTAIHRWFGAQLWEHGNDARPE